MEFWCSFSVEKIRLTTHSLYPTLIFESLSISTNYKIPFLLPGISDDKVACMYDKHLKKKSNAIFKRQSYSHIVSIINSSIYLINICIVHYIIIIIYCIFSIPTLYSRKLPAILTNLKYSNLFLSTFPTNLNPLCPLQ